MGIDIVSVLANSHSQLTKSTGVELPDLNPQIDPMYYATRLFVTWCELHHPTWQQLLDVLQDIGLTELSQQIDAFMRGKSNLRFIKKTTTLDNAVSTAVYMCAGRHCLCLCAVSTHNTQFKCCVWSLSVLCSHTIKFQLTVGEGGI